MFIRKETSINNIYLHTNTIVTILPVTEVNIIRKIDILESIYCLTATNSMVQIDISCLDDQFKELTLKAGDTIAFTSGHIQYEEYTL